MPVLSVAKGASISPARACRSRRSGTYDQSRRPEGPSYDQRGIGRPPITDRYSGPGQPSQGRGTRPGRQREGNMRRLMLAATVSLLAVTSAQAQVTQEDIANDATTTGDVVTNGMGQTLQRYSPLDTLNRDNVRNLVPAWAFSLGGEKQRGQETQPLVYDGIMYITGSYSRMYAIDIKTGQELWQYDARLPEGILPCCDVVNRGAAIY